MTDTSAVLITSRGNPDKLIATCMALHGMACRPDLLRFAIRCDVDDFDTIAAVGRLGKHMNVHYRIGSRPRSLGAELNALVSEVDAGFYHVINDDVLPLTAAERFHLYAQGATR